MAGPRRAGTPATALAEPLNEPAEPTGWAYAGREPRTLRENHPQAEKVGNMVAYRFVDVLEFAYSQGFVRFTEPHVDIYAGPGFDVPIAVVTVGAVFVNQDGTETVNYGTGDASINNCVNKGVGKHYVRMAETRAQARALGRGLNLNAVFHDELAGDDDDSIPAAPRQARIPARRASNNNLPDPEDPANWPAFNNPTDDGFICEVCGDDVKGKSAFWAMSKAGQILCWDHQQAALKSRG